MNAQANITLFVGQAVEWQNRGWIAAVEENDGPRSFTLSGGMQENRFKITVVWEGGGFSEGISEHIAAPWIERGRHLGTISADKASEMLADARAEQAARMAKQEQEREEYAAKVSAWRDSIRDRIPADAQAVIVARLEIDDSDTMTDYFNTKTGETVILAFSRHGRDLFPELRKAAARYSETEHLTDAPESAEHREKYSMGAGYYLKDGHRYSTGWKVEKVKFYGKRNDPAENVPFGEWAVTDGAPYVTGQAPAQARDTGASETIDAETVNGCTITAHTHTKKGFRMFIVELPDRVDRDAFNNHLARAKAARGWYSRKWGKSPAGFAFKDQDAARKFARGC